MSSEFSFHFSQSQEDAGAPLCQTLASTPLPAFRCCGLCGSPVGCWSPSLDSPLCLSRAGPSSAAAEAGEAKVAGVVCTGVEENTGIEVSAVAPGWKPFLTW